MIIKIDKEEYLKILAGIVLLTLFPGFYFYHQAVASKFISGFLGGFFTPLSLLFFAVFILFVRQHTAFFQRAPIFSSLVLFAFFWFAMVSFFNLILVDNSFVQPAFLQLSKTLLLWCVLFFVGLYLTPEQTFLQGLMLFSGVLIFLFLVQYVVQTGHFFYYAAQTHEARGIKNLAGYQGFARSALIVALFCLASTKKTGVSLIIITSSFFVLFILGARSEFAAFVIVVALFILLRELHDISTIVIPIVAFFILAVCFIFYSDSILSSRQLQLFDLNKSSSWQVRNELKEEALIRIRANPILGTFGGHVSEKGTGRYVHNVLSAWDGFGLPGFILYFLLNIIPAVDSGLMVLKKRRLTVLQTFYALLSWTCLILLLVSKPLYWSLPALVWGLYINVKSEKRYLQNKPRRNPQT